MAICKKLAPDEPEQRSVTLAMKCAYYLLRTEEQVTRARKMISVAREMCETAAEMRKLAPRFLP